MAKVKELLVTERELIERLSLITGHNKDVVRDVIKTLCEFVIDEVSNGIPVRLGSLGEFSTYICTRNGGYDFATKKMMPKKEGREVKFRCSKTIRRAVHQTKDL